MMQKQNPKYSLFTIHSCQARFWSIMFYLNMGETAKMAIEWGIDRNVIRNHWVWVFWGTLNFETRIRVPFGTVVMHST